MPADRDFVASATSRLKGVGRRSGATDFGRWWVAELGALLPSATRSAVRRRRMRPVVAFADDAATVWLPSPRGSEVGMDRAARVALGDDAAGRAAIAAIARAAGSTGVVIALPAQHVLRRTLVLPQAIEENLRQAVAYDLDRHTPFKPEDLYFDAAIVGRDPARGALQVDLVTARRAIVDKALAAVEGWGGRVIAVVPDAPDAAAAARLNLLPEERKTTRRGPGWALWVALVLLAAAGAVALALPIWQKREHAIALSKMVDDARAKAAISEALRRDLDRLVGTYNFALERKFAFPPTVQVLDEVTKLLPDDTWLTQLELKTAVRGKEVQRELLLRGESGNAGRLITLFEESKVFTQAAPRSPTTKIQPGPGEIFDLVAQVRPLPLPAPTLLDTAAAAKSEESAGPAGATRPPPGALAAPPADATASQAGPATAPAAGTAEVPVTAPAAPAAAATTGGAPAPPPRPAGGPKS